MSEFEFKCFLTKIYLNIYTLDAIFFKQVGLTNCGKVKNCRAIILSSLNNQIGLVVHFGLYWFADWTIDPAESYFISLVLSHIWSCELTKPDTPLILALIRRFEF